VWISLPAHDQASRFNGLSRLGGVGTVFQACCLLETTTFCFLYRRMPTAPNARDSSLVLPAARHRFPAEGGRSQTLRVALLFFRRFRSACVAWTGEHWKPRILWKARITG